MSSIPGSGHGARELFERKFDELDEGAPVLPRAVRIVPVIGLEGVRELARPGDEEGIF